MKAIISHQNIDFDGLASMVACSKLHPDSVLFFTGKVGEEVKKFVSMYKNVLSVKNAKSAIIEDITELFITDVNSRKRIGKFKELIGSEVPITIYDHHPITENTIEKASKTILFYGACTTILLKEIIEKNIEITTFEATLFALGIYSDTNCLTFSHTTYHDAEIVAYLLKKGANLSIINEHLVATLSDEHNQLFERLIKNTKKHEINGYKVMIATAEHDSYVGELGTMSEKIIQMQNCDAVFLVVKMLNRCYIVGRSVPDEINVPLVLKQFHGGGHNKAASATIKDGEVQVVREQLILSLHQHIKFQMTAREVMSTPVKVVYDHMTIGKVNKIMLRYGHTGMPVLNEKQVVGIISRTDVDKAIVHSLEHAPVKGFMTRQVKTIKPETPVNEINKILVQNNIGRLPVVENDIIIGIVTRTDMLRVLYGKNHPYWYKKTFNLSDDEIDTTDLIEKLPAKIKKIINVAGEVGDLLNANVYVVGGFVRDLFLDLPNWDIDFVIDGDGIDFAHKLEEVLGGEVVEHEKFSTAVLTLKDGLSIDIVSARREYYEYPGALPKVEKSSIWSDLFRRDFTINCMAVALNKKQHGRLIDFFGGLDDLNKGKIRVLYNLSFIEDPTRIFRAIRFAARYSFEIENESKSFIKQAVKDGLIQKLSSDRVREEIAYILREENVCKSLMQFRDFHILESIHPEFNISDRNIEKVTTINSSIYKILGKNKVSIDKQLIIILQIITAISIDKLPFILNYFIGSKIHESQVLEALKNRKEIYSFLGKTNVDLFQLYKTLKPFKSETIVFYYNDCDNSLAQNNLLYYYNKLRNTKISLTGKDLMKLGIKPGPVYKNILNKVTEARVKGFLRTKNEEIEFAAKAFAKMKGE
ncbi:MAG: polynucleotide adenylyltransferase [Alkaliphilus sp.]|nr:CBS domain-containing protein [Alkaliphilus sp. AH-315-G20]PHS36538.1 MAG: polynucleotide adenylyltransferase [Alkaliphilus sp.]